MSRYQTDDPKMREFAPWLMKNMNQKQRKLCRVILSVKPEYRVDVFTIAIEQKAGEYARLTMGGTIMKRREHYEAAAQTIVNMIASGEIDPPAELKL